MDLDFSFALVSSLTPCRKAEKTNTTQVSKKNNFLKTKLNLPIKSQNFEGISLQKREEKENSIPKEQLMSKNEFAKPKECKRNSNSSNNIHRRQSNEKCDFSVNMENIVIRRNRTRGRKKLETIPLQPCDNVLEISSENLMANPSLPNERLLPCVPDVINISSDTDENYLKTESNHSKSKTVKGESPYLSRVDDSSLEIVESSCSEMKGDSFDNLRNLRSLSTKRHNVKTRPMRTSGKSETSLSTAYDSDSFQFTRKSGKKLIPETLDSDDKTADDSDSFQATRRSGRKVIPETPDSDESLVESLSEKNKSLILSFPSGENKESCILRSFKNESPKKNAKRKSSEISGSPDETSKICSTESLYPDFRSKKRSSLSSITTEKNKNILEVKSHPRDRPSANNNHESQDTTGEISKLCDPSKPSNKSRSEGRLKKKLRTSNASSVSDMFKLESTIKDCAPPCNKKEDGKPKFGSISLINNENKNNSFSNVLKEGNLKINDSKNAELEKKKKIKEKQPNTQKQAVDDRPSKINPPTTKNKNCSPSSPKMSTLVLPSEIIPKFEHINQWLKDTQEKTIGSVEIDPPIGLNDVKSKKDIMPITNKYKVSLSPRIKKKKEKAKTSLEEEKKLFEELYGADYERRLNNDVDDAISETSCQDSVEFSENVLDKLYGTVWQKDTAVVQSEPRKGRKNTRNKTSLSDRKKHRTSIYEVFSSSSSEDRFEEFLETVQRGRVARGTRRKPSTADDDFINDSGSDNTSPVFYQNIVSSAVKDQVNSLKREDIKDGKNTHKINRRRLSFGSSKDDGCSESGKSDTKPSSKSKKSSNKDKTQTKKSRSKKKTNKNVEERDEDEADVFSLVTPIRIKGKKTETDLSEKVRNPIVPEVPRSVGKSKTPKNSIRKKDLNSSEERLKTTYLRDCDFKVPKSSKTPSRPAAVTAEVPSSPALSFLSSLSEMTAGLPCHPDALIYKKNFKTKREELTKRLFTLYNKEIFDNQLPADMLIQWSTRMTSTSGYCYNKRIYRDNQILRSSRIVLSTKILDRADRLRDTLIHELCHAATWVVHATSDGHGPIWRSWADRANRRFPELPVIKRCHDYAISTKFTYKCMSCGYSIGRHTKSLDTDRKRCGYCFGKFEVFVTAKMASASVTSGSDSVKTPRGPTGFALFVKENYATVKRENNVPHAQVMKLLSQKFAEVKISKQNSEPIVIE